MLPSHGMSTLLLSSELVGVSDYRRQDLGRELDQLYRVQGASMTVIAQRYGRSQSWVKDHLIAAGVAIRPRGQVAAPRHLEQSRRRLEQIRRDAETAQVVELYVTEQLNLEVIGKRYGHTADWAKVRLRDAGVVLRAAGRHRPEGVEVRVRELLDQGLRVSDIAAQLGYLSDWPVLNILRAQGWSGPPRRPRGPTRALPPLLTDVLRDLYVGQGLTVPEIALRLGATQHRVRKTLRENQISRYRPGRAEHGPPAPIDLEQLDDLYRVRHLTSAQIAEVLGTTPTRVLAALRRAGIDRRSGGSRPAPPAPIDSVTLTDLYVDQRLDDEQIGRRYRIPTDRIRRRRRELGVVRPTPTGPRPHPAPPAADLRQHYCHDQLTLVQVAKLYQTSGPVVRRWLVDAGIAVAPRTTRATRRQLNSGLLRQLYLDREWSAEQIAVDQDVTLTLVLRTLHEHGVAVRPGGRPPSRGTAVPMDPRLVALYQDVEVTELLRRYRIPRREQTGTITERFPSPVPISTPFLRAAYITVGLSCQHLEWLTGHPAEQILTLLHDNGIAVRAAGAFSPWLLKYRRELRAAR